MLLLRWLLATEEISFEGEHYEVGSLKSLIQLACAVVSLMIRCSLRQMPFLAARNADTSVVANNPRVETSMGAFEKRLR